MSDMRRTMRLVENLLLEFVFTVDSFERKLIAAQQLATRGANDAEKQAGKLAMDRLLVSAKKELGNVYGSDKMKLRNILSRYADNVDSFDYESSPLFAEFPKKIGDSTRMKNAFGRASITLDKNERYDIRFFWVADDQEELQNAIKQSGFDPTRMKLSNDHGYWKCDTMQSYDTKNALFILTKGNYKSMGAAGRGFGG